MKKTALSFMSLSALFILPLNAFSEPQDEYNGLIAQDDRVADVETICRGLKKIYAGWKLKQQITQGEGYLLNPSGSKKDLSVANGESICPYFIQQEHEIPDPNFSGCTNKEEKLEIARSNLAFSDRLLRLAAAFKDSHLSIQRRIWRTRIDYGVQIKRIRGDYFISTINPAQGRTWAAMGLGDQAPKIGDRVVKWGDQSVEEAVRELMPYVSASTERARREDATVFLGTRNFHYPESPDLKITYCKENDCNLTTTTRVFYNGGGVGPEKTSSIDDLTFLTFIGAVNEKEYSYETSDELGTHKVIKKSGKSFSRQNLDGNLKDAIYYRNSNDDLIAITARLKSDPGIAYLKIFGFDDDSKEWSVKSKTGSEKVDDPELENHLKKFLLDQGSNPRIILDLRHNGGGNPSNVHKLVSLFVKQGEVARVSNTFLPVAYNIMNQVQGLSEKELGFDLSKQFDLEKVEEWRKQFELEKSNGIFISPPLPEKSIESAGVFNGLSSVANLLVWTGSECVSACERAVMTLADNGIGKIMGTPTSGTGMGMIGDSLDHAITTETKTHNVSGVPNRYFGRPKFKKDCENLSLETGATASEILDCRIRSISENQPIAPHHRYEESLDDLLYNGKGWIEESLKVFSEDAKIATAPPTKKRKR
ncbi:MAG: hypothetical protein KGP28_05045 [Bdellovibrionales bacterium]|nr:hypothetical protein [Bdellovibrionales bacterium]